MGMRTLMGVGGKGYGPRAYAIEARHAVRVREFCVNG